MSIKVIRPSPTPDKEVTILIHNKGIIRDAYYDLDKETGNKWLVIRQTNMSEDGAEPAKIKTFRLNEDEVKSLFELIVQNSK